MHSLHHAFFLMTLLYLFSMVVAPTPKEFASQRRKMSELSRQRSYRKVEKVAKKHDADWENAVRDEGTASYNKEHTSNPFKKVWYWSEEKSQNRKASKASSGRTKANLEIMERKKAAGINP